MDECKAGIRYVFQTNNKVTLSLSSTGHSAMECAMTNLLELGDVILIASNGIWGERAGDMAKRQGKLLLLILRPASLKRLLPDFSARANSTRV